MQNTTPHRGHIFGRQYIHLIDALPVRILAQPQQIKPVKPDCIDHVTLDPSRPFAPPRWEIKRYIDLFMIRHDRVRRGRAEGDNSTETIPAFDGRREHDDQAQLDHLRFFKPLVKVGG